MNQSEINTAFDNAYHQLPAIANVMDKGSKVLIGLALQSLYLGIKESEAVTPEVAPTTLPYEGTDIQQAISLRKIKIIQENLITASKEDLPLNVKENIISASDFLSTLIYEKERPEREAAEKAEQKAKFEEEQRLENEFMAEQARIENEKIEKEAAEKVPETTISVSEEPIQ